MSRIIPIVDSRNVLTVRASAWGSLFDCAHRFEGEQLLGMRKPKGLRTQLGTALHASTATFDKGRLPGASPVTVDEAERVWPFELVAVAAITRLPGIPNSA